MMTQRERLASGYLYTDMDEGMPEERLRGKCWRMNLTIRPPQNPRNAWR
jgi:galactoside O-acetyltransferase